jgi:pimeloyl-ACP methyl ester carboxylesterase
MPSRTGTQREPARPAPRLRRAYYECRYGQLHLHNAIPAGGGFDELTPVICLHSAGETGAVFLPALSLLGLQRSAYAIDLPGAGGSDPAGEVAPVEAAANAVADFIDNMRIRSCDVIARGTAAAAALQLLALHGAALRRVLLVDPPAGVRTGAKLAVLAAAQATPARLVELLAHPA